MSTAPRHADAANLVVWTWIFVRGAGLPTLALVGWGDFLGGGAMSAGGRQCRSPKLGPHTVVVDKLPKLVTHQRIGGNVLAAPCTPARIACGEHIAWNVPALGSCPHLAPPNICRHQYRAQCIERDHRAPLCFQASPRATAETLLRRKFKKRSVARGLTYARSWPYVRRNCARAEAHGSSPLTASWRRSSGIFV